MAFHNNPRIVTEDLIGCWDANMKSSADSGAKLYDRVGSNDATLYNGNCLDFDGTDDNIYTTSDITMSGACTVALWVYSETGTNYIFSNRSGGPVNLMWRLYSNYLDYYYYVAPWKSMLSTSTISLNTWTHIAWTRSSDNYISFFINGELDKRDQATNGSNVDTSTTVNGPVNIVGGYWGSADFNGKMADFKVFNVELSPAQIKEMYKDSKVVVPRGIAHSEMDLWYPMNEGNGSDVYDGGGVAGSALNLGEGQNFNNDEFLTAQAGPPQLATGYNRPLLGDGATDLWVNFGDPSTALDIGTGSFTLGYWINPKSITGNYIGHVTLTASAGTARFEVAFYGSTIRVYTTNGSWNNTGYAPTLNRWTHILFKRQSNSITMHVNGSSSATWTLSSSVTLGPWTAMKMMHHSTGTTYACFDGLLNEVVFYNTGASNTAIAKLATKDASGRPMPPDPRDGGSGMESASYLKGYWRNDGDVTWKDLSGNGNHGTVTNSNGTILLREGYAKGRDIQGFPLLYHNNGAMGLTQTSGSKINIPHASNILWNSAANFTIGVWYKHPSNPSGTYPSIWGKGGQSESGPGYELFLNPSGTSFTLRGTWDGGPTWGMTAAYSSAGNPRDGDWHYIVTVVDREGDGACLYSDGAKQTTVDISGLGDTTNTVNLTLGSAGAGLFHGQIAGAQIYNRALTGTEVAQNYNAHKARFRK